MSCRLVRAGLCALLALVLCAPAAPVHAQGGTTSAISGRVTDSQGGVLPGATVTATHLASGVITTTTSNAEGAFTMASLPTGAYEVSVSLDGFKTSVIKDVALSAVQGASLRATLEVGGISETVTVSSTSEIIQTQSTTISSTINTNQISKLPLTSRSAMDFVNFLPGVSTPGGNRNASVNGLPQGLINITLDGINIQDNTNRTSDGFFAIVSPRLDAVEEVSVTTAGQGGDAGQGAVQIKLVTRSGGQTMTGSAYHFYRNDALTANTWFNNRAGTAKPELLQHQTGGRLGGPLVIPGILPRGKAFFFGNYEELFQPADVTRDRTLLNPGAMAGDFTYTVDATGVTRTINVLQLGAGLSPQTSTPDPTIAALLGDIRAATAGSTLQTVDENIDRFRFNVPVESRRRFPTGRIDYNVTANHRFSSSLNYNWFTDSPDTLNNMDPTFPGFPAGAGQKSVRLSVSNTLRSTLGASFVNEVRVGYSGAPVEFFTELNPGMYTGSVANTKGFQLGVTGGTQNNLISVGSNITSASRIPIPQSRNATDLTIEDTITWLKGAHNITAGGSWANFNIWAKNSSLVPRIQFGMLTDDPVFPAFSLASLPGASNDQLDAARNLYALLTGRISAIAADARLDEATGEYVYTGVGLQRSNMQEFDFFVQDAWRLRPNLTVNAGVRYALQLPFTASNNSYTTPRVEDVCGKSGVDAGTGYCNLFQPGFMPGKQMPEFHQLPEGQSAYNTDFNNIAPNFGVAWTPASREGLLGALMSDEFVVRAGWSRAFSRNGMGDFTGTYNSNPGVVISANRSSGLNNLLNGGPAPLLFREDARLGPPAFAATPAYPMTDEITADIRMFDPNIEIPYADSWSAGFQRKVSTNMALEVRYVGTSSANAWATRNYNEINIWENGFVNEFRAAQANLQANIAAGIGNTFAFTGAPGTAPLPILLAHFNRQPTANAANSALYTGTNWRSATFLRFLAAQNPNPFGFASTNTTSGLVGNATFRNNALAAGLPANLFLANPDLIGGAFFVLNSHKTRHHSMQVELRRRLANGLQFQTSYVLGNTEQTVFNTHRRALYWQRDVGDPGDLRHQFKGNVVYDLPFGQGRRFLGNAGGVMERIVGGWQLGMNARVQSGRLLDLGNVRLVGWSIEDVQKAFALREIDINETGQKLYMWPQDVIDNTMRAFNVSATSATGYSGEVPTGRYFAPANGPDCIEVDSTAAVGECGGVRTLVLTGPLFFESDLRVAKRTPIVGRVNVEFAAEILNVFNRRNFVPVDGSTGTGTFSTLANYEVTGLTGTNQSRRIQLMSRINW